MKKFVLALSLVLFASSSASAWPRMVVYGPVGAYPVPAAAYFGTPAAPYFGAPPLVTPSFNFGVTVTGLGAPYYAYGYPGYIPGQPVRNLLRAAW
jgi:hypothetical protein